MEIRSLPRNDRVPLFITRFSLSSRSAIGVQTKRLIASHRRWLHLHWVSYELSRQHSSSRRAESAPFSRWSALRRRSGLFHRLYPVFGSWWVGNRLRPGAAEKVAAFRSRVSVAYAAPLDNTDAERIRQIVQLVQRPFVLHLWDLLDGPPASGSDMQWLITHAERVFCLSAPLAEEVKAHRPDAEMLLFSREPSLSQAKAPQSKLFKVALIGDLTSYKEGLSLLDEATGILAASGLDVQICYVGPASILKKLNLPIVSKIKHLGFRRRDADKDRALSECHAAFLSGPSRSPETDMRSRYSIPSRVLDFFAVGLPVVGTLHPLSATGELFRSTGITEAMFCTSGAEVAEALRGLLQRETWATRSAASRHAYAELHRESPPETLKLALETLAVGNSQRECS